MAEITDEIRDQAILICAIAASNPDLVCNYEDIEDELQANIASTELALAAWLRARAVYPTFTLEEWDAEAEALLQTGWSP